MLQAFLIRRETSDQGTIGILVFPTLGFSCFTMELPWRDNKQNISCIPVGSYRVDYRESKRRGPCYHIKGVDERTYILKHSGNFAGDVEKGFKSHSQGCVLVGLYLGVLQGQKAVLSSKFAMTELVEAVGKQSFQLTILGNL